MAAAGQTPSCHHHDCWPHRRPRLCLQRRWLPMLRPPPPRQLLPPPPPPAAAGPPTRPTPPQPPPAPPCRQRRRARPSHCRYQWRCHSRGGRVDCWRRHCHPQRRGGRGPANLLQALLLLVLQVEAVGPDRHFECHAWPRGRACCWARALLGWPLPVRLPAVGGGTTVVLAMMTAAVVLGAGVDDLRPTATTPAACINTAPATAGRGRAQGAWPSMLPMAAVHAAASGMAFWSRNARVIGPHGGSTSRAASGHPRLFVPRLSIRPAGNGTHGLCHGAAWTNLPSALAAAHDQRSACRMLVTYHDLRVRVMIPGVAQAGSMQQKWRRCGALLGVPAVRASAVKTSRSPCTTATHTAPPEALCNPVLRTVRALPVRAFQHLAELRGAARRLLHRPCMLGAFTTAYACEEHTCPAWPIRDPFGADQAACWARKALHITDSYTSYLCVGRPAGLRPLGRA